MKIIIGLGNPTAKYSGTRHNIGFAVIDEISKQHNIDVSTKKHKALIGKGVISGEKVILVKPLTYMNLSGESVREIVDYYKCTNEDIIVIYDDVSLAVGKLRLRPKGSAGGHNGIKSIIAHLGTDVFKRIRVGVGEKPNKMDLADYVLGRFVKEELPYMNDSTKNACEAISVIIEDGIDQAMNKFN